MLLRRWFNLLVTVTIIEGVTGCGKSSLVPLYLLEQADKKLDHISIVVAQPRRLAAKSLARYVSGKFLANVDPQEHDFNEMLWDIGWGSMMVRWGCGLR